MEQVSKPRQWRLEIDWCGRPVGANTWYGKGPFQKMRLVKEWRQWGLAAAQLAKLPKDLVGFEAEIQFRYRNGQLTDSDAGAPTWKALCDGLIDYGLAPDDTAEFFHGVKLLPPHLDPTQPHAVIVVIREVIDRERVRL